MYIFEFLPAGFFNARYQALPGKLSETNPAKLEIADITSGPAAQTATVMPTGRKLRFYPFPFPFFYFCCCRHSFSCS
jgi:hypothetical protein